MAKASNKYKVKEKYSGCTIGATPPPYERKEKGVFKLNEATQKDLAYLYEVIGMKDKIEPSVEPTPE